MASGRQPRAGFTLIELMVVVAILGILTAIAIPSLTGQQGKAFDARVRQDARNAATGEEAYYVDFGAYMAGDCSDLPGVKVSPGVTCTAAVPTPGRFVIETSHDTATMTCSWTSDASPNLACVDSN